MILTRIFTIIFFAVIIAIVYFYLKPFRLHNTYKYSTVSLKLSFLLYLVIAMITAFMFMFYRNVTMFNYDFSITSGFMYLVLMIMIVGLIFPTLGILFRRKIKSRQQYNIFLTGLNAGFIIFMLVLLLASSWNAMVLSSL